MLRSIFGAAVWSRRRSLAWWIGGSFVYLLFLGSAFPTLADNAADFEKMLDSYPEALRAMFNMVEGVSLSTGPGFLHMELFSLVLPLLLIVFAVGFGARAIAGEEEEGTLDLILSGPITRRRVLAEQFAAMAASTFAIGLVNFAAMLAAGAVFDMGLVPGRLAAATFGVVLIALVFGALALAVGAVTGRRGVAIAVAAATALASYLVFSLADVVTWLGTVQKASPWYYYAESAPLLNGLEWAHAGVLAAIAVALPVAGGVVLERRDLAV
ncbi:MAG: ABC transporter permease subunit [Actinomycetota bacterium]